MKHILLFLLLIGLTFQVVAQDQEEDDKDDLRDEVFGEDKEEKKGSGSFTLDASDATLEEQVVITEKELDSKTQKSSDTKSEKNKKRRDDDVQTLAGKESHNGGFGAITFSATDFNDKDMILLGFRGGWIINRALAIGLEGYGLIPIAEFEAIDPDNPVSSRVVGGYGGLFLEPIIYSNNIIHATFPISSGAGWVGYVVDWENNFNNYYSDDLIDGDVIWYIQPGVNAELNVARNFRIALGASYRFVNDLQLVNTPSDAFNGWNYTLTLKFGSF
jgi:hypothetical protein